MPTNDAPNRGDVAVEGQSSSFIATALRPIRQVGCHLMTSYENALCDVFKTATRDLKPQRGPAKRGGKPGAGGSDASSSADGDTFSERFIHQSLDHLATITTTLTVLFVPSPISPINADSTISSLLASGQIPTGSSSGYPSSSSSGSASGHDKSFFDELSSLPTPSISRVLKALILLALLPCYTLIATILWFNYLAHAEYHSLKDEDNLASNRFAPMSSASRTSKKVYRFFSTTLSSFSATAGLSKLFVSSKTRILIGICLLCLAVIFAFPLLAIAGLVTSFNVHTLVIVYAECFSVPLLPLLVSRYSALTAQALGIPLSHPARRASVSNQSIPLSSSSSKTNANAAPSSSASTSSSYTGQSVFTTPPSAFSGLHLSEPSPLFNLGLTILLALPWSFLIATLGPPLLILETLLYLYLAIDDDHPKPYVKRISIHPPQQQGRPSSSSSSSSSGSSQSSIPGGPTGSMGMGSAQTFASPSYPPGATGLWRGDVEHNHPTVNPSQPILLKLLFRVLILACIPAWIPGWYFFVPFLFPIVCTIIFGSLCLITSISLLKQVITATPPPSPKHSDQSSSSSSSFGPSSSQGQQAGVSKTKSQQQQQTSSTVTQRRSGGSGGGNTPPTSSTSSSTSTNPSTTESDIVATASEAVDYAKQQAKQAANWIPTPDQIWERTMQISEFMDALRLVPYTCFTLRPLLHQDEGDEPTGTIN